VAAVATSPWSIATVSGKAVLEIDGSGTITTGGTAQPLFAAASVDQIRTGYWVQNQSSGSLWIVSSDRAAAAVEGQPSLEIAAGAIFVCPAHMVSQGAFSIIGATTSQAFAAVQVFG
jgi:hypothetical protein